MAVVNEWSPSDENEESLMKKTLELLKNGEEKIILQDQYKKIVLVVGDTGNGKTTFTKWIAGDDTKLTAIETTANTGEYTIEDIDGTPSSITISDTVYPLLVVDKETNVPYYDCPGFNDTRNTKYDIATTHFIKKIVNFADSVKIIFIINYPWVRIGVDRHSFMQLLKQATEFIKNIEKLKNSFALVVTKVDNSYINGTCLVEDNAIIAGIADFLKKVMLELEAQVQGSQERQFYEAAIKFISYFLKKDGEQYANIGIFRRPDKSGPLSKIPLLLKGKENIKRIIYQNLTFAEKVDDDFSYTISLKSKNIIARKVEEINKNIWQSLGYITEELGKYYSTLTYEVRKQILLIGYVDSLLEADDLRIKKLSCCLRRGIKSISEVIKDIENVQSRYDLAQRIKNFIVDSEIGDFKTEISNIENQGKCFDFLQVVSEEKLNTRSWDELFRKVLDSIFDVQKKLQEDIDELGPKIRKHVLSCFDTIAKDLQNQLDGKIKILDLQDVHDKLNEFSDSMLWLVEKGKNITNAKEFLKLIRDVTCRIMINVPNEAAMHIMKLENCLNSLQIFCKTNCIFVSSAWFQPFENLIDHLNEYKVWYNFLASLYHTFSEYEIQKEKEKYTVDNKENWGNAEAASEISITEANFQQFLQNISQNNVSELEIIKNIELTEDRIEELNRILNLALNQKVIMDSTNSSIFITGDYIRISNFIKITNFLNDILAFSSLTKLGQFKSVYIFALNTVFIDEDLKLPSLNVIIIAPKWEIIGKRKICLDGTGRDRELGLTEKSGRIFFGIGETFINSAQLTITVEGGNVSSGQNGNGRKSGESGNQVIVQGQKHRSTTFFTISGAKSNNTWNLEECILNYDRVDSERDDADGANIKGLRFSKLANNISEPFKIINKYTKYLAEQLKYSFKRVSLLSFYKKLNDNNGIISIYNTVGLIEEFQEIEQENDSSSLKQSYLIPIYQSVLNKISIHAKLTENSDDDHMKVLKYLCTAILSKISILRDESQANLIIDIGKHLDMIKTDIEMLKDLQMQSKLPSLISKCKEYYNYDVNKRVGDVKNFILEHILPEFIVIQRQVDKDIKYLVIEAIKLQKDAKKEKDKLILTKQKLEDSLAQKQVLYCFDIIAKVVTFLCPVGAAIDLAIEKVASKVELLALNETEISSKKVPNITSILQLFENEIIRVKNGALNHLNTLLRAISYQAKRYPESLKDLLKVIEEIQIRKNNVNEKNLRLAEIKMIEDDIKKEIIKKEQKLRSQLSNQNSKDVKKVMNRLSKIAHFGSLIADLEIYDESDCSKLDELVSVIESAEKKFLNLKQCEENIYNSVAPMIKSMEDVICHRTTRLDSKIDLDLTNWQVLSSLRKIHLQMKKAMESFKVQDNIVHCFDMLQEATTNLIQIYEKIENYREQRTLDAYIGDISSVAVQNVGVSDQKLAKALKELEVVLKSNMVLKHYKTALHAFRQWMFPFSQNYIEDSMLPNNIRFERNIEKLASDCLSHIEHMMKNIDVYKTSVMRNDNYTQHGEFNSFNGSTEPFFVWKNEKYKYLISKLLSGEEIVLKSEVKKSPTNKDAIKFSFIEFHFKCKNESLQSQLDQLLKGFDLVATHEGNSYYRYANKIYLITSDKQTIFYSFEKNKNGESVRTNTVYDKIKRSDLMLSPYTVWKLKLVKSASNSSFDKMSKFKDGIDLELVGHGSYVMNYEPLSLSDGDYRIVEAYNEFDQYID